MDETKWAIVKDYRERRADYVELGEIVHAMLQDIASQEDAEIFGIEHRVKTEESLRDKLERYGDRFHELDDLKDVFGARVITFYQDTVTRLGKRLEEIFEIDWDLSSNKGDLLEENEFGYLSLHYVCRLPSDKGYPERLANLRFEVQIRTMMQHAWAAINHDIGYKSSVGVPRSIARGFYRVAGLLEIADEEFLRFRDSMNKYSSDVRQYIADDTAHEVELNAFSLREFMLYNSKMRSFLRQLAEISGARIGEVHPDEYVDLLALLHVQTLGALQELLDRRQALAYELAAPLLKLTAFEELPANTALRFLCRAELLAGDYTPLEIRTYFQTLTRNPSLAQTQTELLLEKKAEMAGPEQAAENAAPAK
ncbi:MAG: hypothetical protein HDQ87_02865 [Clostridia bacterium]|nr:hypothetical protein [Clostridia bacterium]